MNILLETERLKLCYMSMYDITFMLQLLNSPSYIKYIGDRNVSTRMEARKYLVSRICNAYAGIGYGYYLVRRKKDGKKLGICGLLKRDTLEHVDVGFAFLPDYEGKGYGYESASALMKWGKQKFGWETYAGITLENNKASIHLLEKLGLSYKKKVLVDDEELLLFSGPCPE